MLGDGGPQSERIERESASWWRRADGGPDNTESDTSGQDIVSPTDLQTPAKGARRW